MSPRGQVATCERCRHAGSLALFRSPDPQQVTDSLGGVHYTYAVVLCVCCAEVTGWPRWFHSVPKPAVHQGAA